MTLQVNCWKTRPKWTETGVIVE